eukprot:c24200_g1_i1 orf=616-1440(-)
MKESRLQCDVVALHVHSPPCYTASVVQYPFSSDKNEQKRLRSGAIQPVDEQSTPVLSASVDAKDTRISARRTGAIDHGSLERIWKGKRQRSNLARKLPRSAEDPLQRSKFSVTHHTDAETISRHRSPMRVNDRHNQVKISYQNEKLLTDILSSDRQDPLKDSKRAWQNVPTRTMLKDLLPIKEGLVQEHGNAHELLHSSLLQQKLSRPYQRKELPMGSPPELSFSRLPPRQSLYSPHELHYKNKQKNSEKMRKKTYLPYKQNLLACFGFCTRTH